MYDLKYLRTFIILILKRIKQKEQGHYMQNSMNFPNMVSDFNLVKYKVVNNSIKVYNISNLFKPTNSI